MTIFSVSFLVEKQWGILWKLCLQFIFSETTTDAWSSIRLLDRESFQLQNTIFLHSHHHWPCILACTACHACKRATPKYNVSYFVMLSHNIKGGCWWYGRSGWTFPPITHNFFFALLQIAADRQSGKMASDMKAEVCHWIPACRKKFAPVNIHWCLLSIYGDQKVAVSMVRWWIVYFSSGDSNVSDKPRSME